MVAEYIAPQRRSRANRTAGPRRERPYPTGIIGAGGGGRHLTGQFEEIGAEMAAVRDIYEPNLQAAF